MADEYETARVEKENARKESMQREHVQKQSALRALDSWIRPSSKLARCRLWVGSARRRVCCTANATPRSCRASSAAGTPRCEHGLYRTNQEATSSLYRPPPFFSTPLMSIDTESVLLQVARMTEKYFSG